EIARRIIRTCERLGIETVAVHSDADAEALHVREATLAHALGGDASADSYLRIDKILAAARATKADAVHPGYGFLSENADFAQAAQRIGYPVMVKAVAGGGGRGMRLVAQPSALHAALQSARSEAQSSFGSGELLVERALLAPRHVEVQVFADAHGHCIHLGE